MMRNQHTLWKTVAEHCDGFAFWDSALTEWDSVDKGPRRDVVAEMEKAVRARGLKFITSFHHHWKWGWYATPSDNFSAIEIPMKLPAANPPA